MRAVGPEMLAWAPPGRDGLLRHVWALGGALCLPQALAGVPGGALGGSERAHGPAVLARAPQGGGGWLRYVRVLGGALRPPQPLPGVPGGGVGGSERAHGQRSRTCLLQDRFPSFQARAWSWCTR